MILDLHDSKSLNYIRVRVFYNECFIPSKERYLVGIIVQEGEPIDRAIKRFKKKYERSGVLKEFKKRAYFTKPSVKKRMKKMKAIRRSKRTVEETD